MVAWFRGFDQRVLVSLLKLLAIGNLPVCKHFE